jgi:hypothetical protein
MRFAAARRQHQRFRQIMVGIYAALLDPHIEHECTAGLFLTIPTVASVNNLRRRRQPVLHRPARASPFQIHLYLPDVSAVAQPAADLAA